MLAIAAVIATAAVPVFSNLLLETRMNAAVSTAMHAVNLARQFSATRSEPIRLCGSDDAHECSGREEWAGNLLLADAAERFRESLLLGTGDGAPRIRSNRPEIDFEGGSGFATPATITICDRRGNRAARAVIVSRSGRPRSSDKDGSSRALTC